MHCLHSMNQLALLQKQLELIKTTISSCTCARDATEQDDEWPFLLEKAGDHLIAADEVLLESPAVHDTKQSFLEAFLSRNRVNRNECLLACLLMACSESHARMKGSSCMPKVPNITQMHDSTNLTKLFPQTEVLASSTHRHSRLASYQPATC